MGNSQYENKEVEIPLQFTGENIEIKNWTSKNITLREFTNPLESLIAKRCIIGDKMNLLCVKIVNDRLNFSYKEDPKEDILYSPGKFIENKGGDCEDWSVYIGTLVKDKDIVAWRNSSTNSVFKYGGKTFIAKNVEFTNAGKLESIVCIKRTISSGHCQLLTSKNYLVEAYNGELVGSFNYRDCKRKEDINCVYKRIPINP